METPYRPLPEYDRKIEQVKAGRGHRYKVEGVDGTLPSVTTICNVINKPWLEPWARKDTAQRMAGRLKAIESENYPGEDGYDEYVDALVADSAADDTEARDLGTATHRLIAEAVNRYPESIEDLGLDTRQIVLAQHAADAGLELLRRERIKVVEVERPVWHPHELYAGTIDLLGVQGNNIVVLDWKRSKTLYRSNMAQPVAYASAFVSTTDTDPFHVAIAVVKLPQDFDDGAEIKYVDLDDAVAAGAAFRKVNAAYQATGALKWGSVWK